MQKKHKCKECKKREITYKILKICSTCYYKKYWKGNPDKYEEQKERVKKYRKTKKGKEVRKQATLKFLKKNPNYFREHSKRLRQERKEKGLCNWCGEKVYGESTTCCKKHLLMKRETSRRWIKEHPNYDYNKNR